MSDVFVGALLLVLSGAATVQADTAIPIDKPRERREHSLSIAINAAGEARFSDAKTVADDTEIARRCATARKADADVHLSIAADADTHYGVVVHVMDLAKQAGVVHISLVVQPK